MKTLHIPDHAESMYSRFEEEGIPLLLAGGWAVCFHGYSRLTTDVDWVCSREFEDRAVRLMTDLGFVKTTDGMASRFRRPGDIGFPPIDLIWVDPDSFARMNVSLERTGRNRDIPVVNFEALLAMKLHALKDNDHRKGKDLVDIRFLLEYNPGVIAEDRLQAFCERFAGPGAYEKVRQTDVGS